MQTDWRYTLKTLTFVWAALPILFQVSLLLVMSGLSTIGLATWAWACGALFALVLCWYAGRWYGLKSKLPTQFWARYCPIVLPALLIWALWTLQMYFAQGDFTKFHHGPAESVQLIALLPYIGLYFFASLAGAFWTLLAPLVVTAVFSIGFLVGGRDQPTEKSSAPWLLMLLISCFAGLTSWQAYQRQNTVITASAQGEVLREEVDMAQYRPYSSKSLLKKLRGEPGLRFTNDDAPRLDGATAAYPVYAAAAQAIYSEESAKQRVRVSKTPLAYDALIDGKTDLIFVAQPSEEQKQRAKAQGKDITLTAIANEAFVFLVNANNPVQNLTAEQIRNIYTGKITRWNEVGGPDEKIVAFQRPKDSGSQTVMQSKVMEGITMREPLMEERAQSMGGLMRQVASYRNSQNALGYSFRYYSTQMERDAKVRLLQVNGIAPTTENIRNGTYPFTVKVYMATAGKPTLATQKLMDWFVSPQAQQLIADVGYVPLR